MLRTNKYDDKNRKLLEALQKKKGFLLEKKLSFSASSRRGSNGIHTMYTNKIY